MNIYPIILIIGTLTPHDKIPDKKLNEMFPNNPVQALVAKPPAKRRVALIEDPCPWLRKDWVPPMYNPCPGLFPDPPPKKYYLEIPLPE